jgi:hypothetical protein
MINRRTFLNILASSLPAAACSTSAPFRSLETLILGNKPAFDASYSEQLPYASVTAYQKGSNQVALLILGKVEGEDLHWISSDRGVLVTRHGRLIRTVGFSENLMKTDFIGHDFFDGRNPASTVNILTGTRIIDLSPGNRYGIKIEARIKIGLNEKIQIGNRIYDTIRVSEDCFASSLQWRYTNTYWQDSNGRIWRSLQYFAPEAQPLIIEITKPHTPPSLLNP